MIKVYSNFNPFFALSICNHEVWEVFKYPAIYQGLIADPQGLSGCGNDRFAATSIFFDLLIIVSPIRTLSDIRVTRSFLHIGKSLIFPNRTKVCFFYPWKDFPPIRQMSDNAGKRG
jgi:hypothetical protein